MSFARRAILFALCAVLSSARAEDDTSGPVFLKEPPNRVDFSNTTGAVVECSAVGNPPPDIIWVRSDGTAVGDVPGLRQVLANGNLVFPPFRAEDYRQEVHAQVYACLAKNSVGSINSRDVNVRAVVNQFYETRVTDEFVLKGNTGILKCVVPSFVTDFVVIEAWVADDGSATYIYNPKEKGVNFDSKYLVLPSGELHIRDVGPEDGYKSYQCRTKHRLTGETRLSATKGRLVITEPTNNVPPKKDGKKFEGWEILLVPQSGTAWLTCQVTAFPAPRYSWYKFIEGTSRKQAVALDDRVKQVAGTLIIREAKVDDSGKYLCVVNNSVGGESVETVLTVTAPLKASIEPKVQTVDFGRPAVFTCKLEGNPIKTISWMKDGNKIDHTDAVLKIDAVRKEDKGMYQCFIRNDQESAEATAELKLGGRFEPPQIRHAFNEETVQPGNSVFLKCIASGNPTPEISWELYGRRLSNSERYQIGQYVTVNGDVVSHLNVTGIHTNDGGLYRCVASSKVGSADHSARINVYGLPFVRSMEKQSIVAGGTLIVHCPFAGHPVETVVWERDGRQLPINRKQKVFPNGTLIIENVERASDQATYVCVTKNSQGYNARGSLEVQVMVLPKIHPFSFGDEPSPAGETISVQCTISIGDLPVEFSWMFNGKPINHEDSISIASFGKKVSVLNIDSISELHAGNYTCIAANKAGMASYTAQLVVKVPPRWILEPTDKAFAQGSDAAVECKADGFPKPVVTWKRATGVSPGDYKDFKPNNPDVRVDEGTLTINNIQKTNEGYYLCEAVNGIGSGLSAVVFISVQAPPHFEVKFRNQTSRRGDPAVLQCEAKGEKPIGILWKINNKRLEPKGDNRYTIREEILPTGVLSDLSIKRTERSDSAIFTCEATNAFGNDETNINMIVQEVPEVPYGLKVLDKSGKTVQLSWVAPYDGNSPIKKYLIEYKPSKGSWEKNSERVLIPGEQTEAGIFTLRPATTYHIRIIAENEIGSSDPSDTVTIITAEEVPGGPPTDIRVEAEDQHTLIVYWKPPIRDHWNGDIQGYYVGYKLANTDKPYLFETVEFPREEEGKEHLLKISNLKTYTQYSVVVQAFNKVGAGPTSEEFKANTAEGVPEQPPDKATCTTLTAQTIRVSWVSPPLTSANGVIKGYKVIYGPSDTWFDENTKDTKITASSETILHGLKKYTNYSMEVLSYTSGGDGVRTTPIACQTEQDVPESPTAVKALVMSADAILVSWKPPTEPNGIIEYYMVYYKVATDSDEKLIKSQKIVPNLRNQNLSFQAKNLDSNLKYEFWVTAATTIGEGQPSKKVTVSPSTSVPAKTASFDDTFTTTYKEDVTLPCLAVGVPPPVITWSIKGVKFNPNTNDRVRQQPDGSLFIRDVTRTDAGEYSCKVENDFGQDSVTHQLIVNAPPRAPQVTLTSTTTNSLTIKIKPHESDGEQVHGYTIHYKPEFGEWETVQVGPATDKYTLEKLLCGTRYQLYVTAYNSIGTGDQSDNLNPKTRGEKPVIPSADKFIEVSSNSITLHLNAWSDGGCPMLYFVIEHKKKVNTEWIQVSNNVKPGLNFVLLDLDPAVWYHLRVTAHNNAGFNVAEYEFATLTVTGGTIAPAREIPKEDTIQIILANLNLVVPVVAAALIIVVAVVVICVLRGKGTYNKDDVVYNQSCNAASTLDKRRPDLRDELGYIAPPNRKLPPVPGSNYNTCDRIKRGTVLRAHYRSHSTWDPRQRHLYEELRSRRGSNDTIHTHRGMDDEICPYATFHLLGFREEMDPSKAMQFQTFPHPHAGTMGPSGMNTPHQMHSRNGSQSMPRQNRRYDRVGSQGNGSIYSPGPEYDDPANCAPEDEQYGSQYGGYGAPYDQYGSRGSIGRRSLGKYRSRYPCRDCVVPEGTPASTPAFHAGSLRIQPTSSSPEPPPPPPRNHDPSFNDSKDSNEISEAECDRDQLINSRTYGVMRGNAKDGMTHEEMRKLIERNETGQTATANGGLTAYDTVAV
ncbi:Down syndrome cell adhesion molecule-like protein Dscam2 [Sitophilus oryzae]|uniref:Down syndrome cell adhesion molecule-like protein Dscam2 n=1 Tax=Sitophilus oryzae TaxID=7048 RepID=A0A6J2YUV3_SITOR|nr:Down syndrome cell adhesion molecule-like protein Dscam2 [Sitophilus oryzae]